VEKDFANLYLENQLCFPLYAASRLTTKMYAPYLDQLSLTYPQYLVMLILWEHKEQKISEIGNKLLLESNTLTPLLKRLEQKQLINRKRCEQDERTVLISLTEQGKEMKEQAVEIPQSIINSFQTSTLSIAEAVSFQKTLLKIIDTLSDQIDASKQCLS
jgi:MarR family transcriptional regulator, organic hydroperoxide resistance regulator